MFGIIKQFFRWMGNWFSRGERRVGEAANNVFTGSASGIADAYDIARDSAVKTYKELEGAISQVEMILEEKRGQLVALNEREKDRIELREGAFAKFDAAPEGSEEQKKFEALFAQLDAEIKEIDAEQEELERSIKESEESMKMHFSRLKQLRAELDKLPQEKADQIAKFVSNKKLIELNDRLQNLETSFDRGPLSAVRKATSELAAQARVSQKMAGADQKSDFDDLRQAARASSARDTLNAMRAARAAERAAKTGADEAPAAAKERKEL